MRDYRINTETEGDGRRPPALPNDQQSDQRERPNRTVDDVSLVKIVSDWRRRDRGLPAWWRDHLLGLFR